MERKVKNIKKKVYRKNHIIKKKKKKNTFYFLCNQYFIFIFTTIFTLFY